MSKINTTDPINWTWFNTITHDDIQDSVLSSIEVIDKIISKLDITEDETEQLVNDIIYTITGIDKNSGSLISQEEWYNIWLSQDKPTRFSFSVNFIIEKVKTNLTNDTSIIVKRFNYISEFILRRYFSTPIPNGYPNSGNKPRLVDNKSIYYTDMTGALHTFFINGGLGLNGVGNNTIQQMCQNFSRTTIANYIPIKNWCGCFAPESKITQQAKSIYPDSGSYTTACDPLCIFPQAIKVVDSDGSNSKCNSTLCIMSKIDIASADLNGSINLNQNCPCASSGQPCFCVIDSSVESLLNKTQGPNGGSMADPVTFKQYCPGAQCFVEEPNGDLTQVKCQNDNPGQTGNISNKTRNINTRMVPNIWFLLFSILLVFITLIQCARYIGYEPKYKVKGLLKPKIKLPKTVRSTDLGFLKKT